MEGVYSERRKGSSWVTEESSDCSVTESERFLPLSLLSSTLGLIILLQQSKLRKKDNGNLGFWNSFSRSEDSSFLFGERGQRCVGERIKKGEQISSTKRDRVRPLNNWGFSLISWGSISSENFSCSISIAKFE